jgi:hypothetical protein
MSIVFGDVFKDLGSDLEHLYLNPNKLQDMSDRLHVCETLFGDFDARVLVLLQDAADVDSLLVSRDLSPSRPVLSHSEKALTNKRLVSWFKDFFPVSIDGSNAQHCGIYYANAVWLLKLNGGMSGPLPQKSKVLETCGPVLSATLQNLERLELILAFGRHSYSALCRLFPLTRSWEEALISTEPEEVIHLGRKLEVLGLNHPAARISQKIQVQRLRGVLKRFVV